MVPFVELGNGLFAPGQIKLDVLRRQVEWLHLPEDPTGQLFMTWALDGFYAFRRSSAARRGCWPDSFS